MRILFVSLTTVLAAQAQVAPLKSVFDFNRTNIVETARKMPEHFYDYQPTAEVRTFRQVYGHLLDALNSNCGKAPNEKSPVQADLEHGRLSKDALVEAARSTFAFCEQVYSKPLTPEETANYAFLLYHTGLHYGNLITYMRLRSIVPPHTEKAQQASGGGQAKGPIQNKMVKYYMGFLKKGPNWAANPAPDQKDLQSRHLAHLGKMAEMGKLAVAGPFTDNTEIRGILIFRGNSTLEELQTLAEEDPAVKAGRLKVELHPWLVEGGYLP